jgi:biotin transporter BioY
MLISEATIYLFGLAWLARFPLTAGFLEACFRSSRGDLYKIALAIALLPPITRRVNRLASKSSS